MFSKAECFHRNVKVHVMYNFLLLSLHHILSCSFDSIFSHCIYDCMFCMLLFNFVSYVFFCYVYVFLLLCTVLYRANWYSSATLTEVFPCFFLSCKANAKV